MKKWICLLMAVLMAVSLFACKKESPAESAPEPSSSSSQSSSEPEPSSSEPESSQPVSSKPEEKKEDGPVDPLTGAPVKKDISMNRPYAVMINNHEVAQPQHGISQASILFEVPVEGGMTRMMAVFQDISDVPVIGSVRSSRHDFLDLVEGLDAIYIHAGGSDRAYDEIYARGIDNVDGRLDSTIFYRDSYRRSAMGYEHSLMTTGSDAIAVIPKYGYRTEHSEDYESGLVFTDKPAMKGSEKAESCMVSVTSWKTTSFTYDKKSGKYMASQYNGPYKDGNTDEQVGFSNVIALFMDMYVMDDVGRMEIDVNSSGTGYYFCDGKCLPINWSKASAYDFFEFTYENGDPVELKTGTTYIALADSTASGVSYE